MIFAVLRVIGMRWGGGPLGMTAIQGMMQPANSNVHASNSEAPTFQILRQPSNIVFVTLANE